MMQLLSQDGGRPGAPVMNGSPPPRPLQAPPSATAPPSAKSGNNSGGNSGRDIPGLLPEERLPWVEGRRIELQEAEQAAKKEAAEGGAFVGTVARISSSMGFGFIMCMESAMQFGGRDVIIGQEFIQGLRVCDSVLFLAAPSDKGTPQAIFIRRLEELSQARADILAVEVPAPLPDAIENPEAYTGFVTSFQLDRGYGFISCLKAKQLYGRDVILHQGEYEDIGVGDAVHFSVVLNIKSMPLARNVRKAGAPGASEATGGSSTAAPPEETSSAQEGRGNRRGRSRSGSRSMSMSQGREKNGQEEREERREQERSHSRDRDRRRRSPSRSRRRRRDDSRARRRSSRSHSRR